MTTLSRTATPLAASLGPSAKTGTDTGTNTKERARDPIVWQALIALVFAGLVWWHLGIPSKIYFDEVHYVPAARELLKLMPANAEHPMVGKEAIAAAIALFGDHPLVWRIPSAVLGPLGLFAFGRGLWWLSGRAMAALLGMVLLASDFAWFVQSRIAMLDMVMAGMGLVGLWMLAAACGLPEGTPVGARRWRLALAGICFGLAIGAKWSIAPPLALAVLTVLGLRVAATGRACLEADDAPPVPGIALTELMFWLTSLPIVTYWASFTPLFFYHKGAVPPTALVNWHRYMLYLQGSVVKYHPYQTHWWQWMLDQRGIWYLYEKVDGWQRGVVLIGNPLTMWAGLPALAWCLFAGLARRQGAALVLAGLYLASIGLWVVAAKPVQFYYHYLMPGTFLMACLALALDAIWSEGRRRGAWWKWAGAGLAALACGIFAQFWPILSAAPLHNGTASFEHWMWLTTWR